MNCPYCNNLIKDDLCLNHKYPIIFTIDDYLLYGAQIEIDGYIIYSYFTHPKTHVCQINKPCFNLNCTLNILDPNILQKIKRLINFS